MLLATLAAILRPPSLPSLSLSITARMTTLALAVIEVARPRAAASSDGTHISIATSSMFTTIRKQETFMGVLGSLIAKNALAMIWYVQYAHIPSTYILRTSADASTSAAVYLPRS